MTTDLAAQQAEWLREFAGYARNEIADGAFSTGDAQDAACIDDALTVITAAADALGTCAHLVLTQAVVRFAQSFATSFEYTQEFPR